MKIKRILALTGASLIMASCLTAGASAMDQNNQVKSGEACIEATQDCQEGINVGGGTWWYGTNPAGWSSSNYMHRGCDHGSSVRGSTFADSGWKVAGELASAGTFRNFFGTTHFHWRTR